MTCNSAFKSCLFTFFALQIILLSGCANTQPVPQKVFINVPTPCIKAENVPAVPATLTDAELSKQGDFDLVITLATERIALRQYAKEAAAVITSCTR